MKIPKKLIALVILYLLLQAATVVTGFYTYQVLKKLPQATQE